MDRQHLSAAEARVVADRTARASYGRLVALLAASSGDLALAEDALATAFERALTTWPDSGVPDNPEGWLLTVARNRQRDLWKSAAYRTAASLAIVGLASARSAASVRSSRLGQPMSCLRDARYATAHVEVELIAVASGLISAPRPDEGSDPAVREGGFEPGATHARTA